LFERFRSGHESFSRLPEDWPDLSGSVHIAACRAVAFAKAGGSVFAPARKVSAVLRNAVIMGRHKSQPQIATDKHGFGISDLSGFQIASSNP